jgi:hypothetical protein
MIMRTCRLGLLLLGATFFLGCGSSDGNSSNQGTGGMDAPPMPPAGTGKCTLGHVVPCACDNGSKGVMTCLETGSLSECSCSVPPPPRDQVDCQPGSRVVCTCDTGGTGNHLCKADSTFEPCSMCVTSEGDAG